MKIMKKKLIIGGIILASLIATILPLTLSTNLISNNIIQYKNDVNNESNIEARSLLTNQANIVLDSDSSFNLLGRATAGSMNAHCAFPGAIVVATSNGVYAVDENTLQVKWQLQNSTGSTTDIIGDINHRVFDMLYVPNMNRLLILHKSKNNNYIVRVVDPNNGKILASTAELTGSMNGSSDFSAVIIPQIGVDGSMSDSFDIVPRGKMRQVNRKIHRIWITSNTIDRSSTYNLYNPGGSQESVLLSFAHFYKSGYGHLVAYVKWNTDNGDVYFETNTGGNTGSLSLGWSYKVRNITFGDDPATVQNFIPNITVSYYGNTIEFSTIINASNSTIGDHSSVLEIDGTLGNSSYGRVRTASLDADANNNQDYDINYGYFNYALQKFVCRASYVNGSKSAIIIIDTGYMGSNTNFSPSGNKVKIFYPGVDDYIYKLRLNNNIVPVVTYNSDISNSNIFTYTKDYSWFVIYNGSPHNNNQTDYPYAYETDLTFNKTNAALSIANVSGVNLKDKDANYLATVAIDPLKTKTVQYSKNSVFSVENYDNSRTSELYQGKARITAKITNAYYNGQKRDKTIANIILSGFYQWETDVTDQIVDEKNINNDDYLDYIKNHYSEYFIDLPLEFSTDNIIKAEPIITNENGQTIGKLRVTLNKWIDSNHVLQSTNQTFDLKLLPSKNTIAGQKPILSVANDDTLKNIYPSEIYNATNISALKTFIINNQWLDDLPSDFDVDNILHIKFGEINNANGTVMIESIVIDRFYVNSVLNTNPKTFVLNYKMTDFIKTNPTSITTSEVTINDVNNIGVNEISITDLKQKIFTQKDDFFTNLPHNFTLDDLHVDIINKDAANGTMVIEVGVSNYFDEHGAIASYPLLTKQVTINGFMAKNYLTTANDQIANPLDVSNINSLSSLQPQQVLGNNVALMQFLIDQQVLKNLPPNFNLFNIKDIHIASYSDNAINIDQIVINQYLNANGEVINGDLTITFNPELTISGFTPSTSESFVSTTLSAPMRGEATNHGDEFYPSNPSDNQIKEDLLPILNTNKQLFNNLPDPNITFDKNNIFIIDKIPNNQTGELNVVFALKDVIINNNVVTLTQDEINQGKGLVFNATITNYKKELGWSQLSLTIDASHHSLYDIVNNGVIESGFDYKLAIKNQIVEYVENGKDGNKAFTNSSIKGAILKHLNDNTSAGFLQKATFSLNENVIRVVDATLFNYDNSTLDWKNGVNFNLINLEQKVTKVTLNNSFSIPNNVTFDEFKNNINQYVSDLNDLVKIENCAIENYSNQNNLSTPDLIQITAVNGNNLLGTGQIALTFKAFITDQGILNDYTYVIDQVFNFKPDVNATITLKPTVVASDLHVENLTSWQLVEKLNSDINATNQWLNQNYQHFVADVSLPVANLTFSNATIKEGSNDQIELTILVNETYLTTTITNLNVIVPTNIVLNSPLPNDVNANNILTYFDDDTDVKAKQFITWNDTSFLPDGSKAMVQTVKVFNLKKNDHDENYSVYINFIFNGIYTSDQPDSFINQYIYQVKINNLSITSTSSNLEAINTNQTDLYIDFLPTNTINNHINLSIYLIPLLVLLTIVAIILLIFVLTKKYQNEKK